jgi:hypothetical protein
MCHVNTVVSCDDGHIVAQNIKEINVLRKTVHQVGFIYKIRQEYLKQNAESQMFLIVVRVKKNAKLPLSMPRRSRDIAVIILNLGFGFR